MFVKKVISGGQTGADQGGLMAAWERGIPTGGNAPAEYRTTLGPNPLLEVLGLDTTRAKNYQVRTCKNVEEADVTLLFGFDLSSPGSQLTYREAAATGKPVFVFEFCLTQKDQDIHEIRLIEDAVSFLLRYRPAIINVAGNRDTDCNLSNYRNTRRIFGLVLDLLKERLDSQT